MRELTYLGEGKLAWRDVAPPSLMSEGDALVRPTAAARCDLDVAILRGRLPLPGPFAFGHEMVGEVVSTGLDVTAVQVGDVVVVPCQISCGTCARCLAGMTGYCSTVPAMSAFGLGPICGLWGGAASDLVRVPYADAMLVKLPAGITPAFVASASDNLPDAWRTVGPPLAARPGAAVLVVGGGAASIGLYAAAMARALGAEVVYVDRDAGRLTAAQAMGAEAVEAAGGFPEKLGPFGVVVDASGHPKGLATALRSVAPGGICTSVGAYPGNATPIPLWDMWLGAATLCTGLVNARADLPKVLSLIVDGGFKPESVPTRVAAWEDAPQAFLDPVAKLVIART